MPLLQKSIQMLGKAMPKVASPRVHAVADYSVALLFIAGAIFFWRKNRRAGVAAFTDYPGGIKRAISLPLHKKIDLGLSTMTAAMPQFLAFEDEKEKAFFRTQSLVIAGLTAVTEFKEQEISGERELIAA
jgi:hypothetical protein